MIIDVSRWQGDVDWNRVRNEGKVSKVIMRTTMGSTGVDERYAEYWRETGWVGIPDRGGYHYLVTGETATNQFNNIMRVTRGDFGNMKYTLDGERTKAERERMALGWVFPKRQYTDTLWELFQKLKAVVPIGIRYYSNESEVKAMLVIEDWLAELGFHVAAYPNDPNSTTYKPVIPKPWTTYEMWQYSSTGRIPGIAGNVDLNREKVALVVTPPVTKAFELIDQATQMLRGLL